MLNSEKRIVEAKNLKTNLHYNLILTTFLSLYKPVVCNKNPTFCKVKTIEVKEYSLLDL